jgi:hypothetical protein
MRRSICNAALLTLFVSLILDVAMADVVRHGYIPAPYWGKWAGLERDGSVIELSAKTYVSDEANCTVDWVSETAGARGAIYSAHLHCFNPAQTTGERFVSNLIIWPQGDVRIAVGPDFMRLKILRRCSAKRPTRSDGARCEDLSSDESRTSLGSECRTDGGDIGSSRPPSPCPSVD